MFARRCKKGTFYKSHRMEFAIKTIFKVLAISLCFPSFIYAANPDYSINSGELHIPYLDVDNNSSYSVKMIIKNVGNLEFAVTELTRLAPFEDRFNSIQNLANRIEVLNALGFPEKIFNLVIKKLPFCSQPTSLNVGAMYEQWEYKVDSTSQGPSGFVVWFAGVSGSPTWTVVGKIKGYSCL